MNHEETRIKDLIVNHIADYAGVDAVEIELDDNLLVSGLVDSVGMMRLIADMEEQLSVAVPPPDLVPENFKTVRVMTVYFNGLASTR